MHAPKYGTSRNSEVSVPSGRARSRPHSPRGFEVRSPALRLRRRCPAFRVRAHGPHARGTRRPMPQMRHMPGRWQQVPSRAACGVRNPVSERISLDALRLVGPCRRRRIGTRRRCYIITYNWTYSMSRLQDGRPCEDIHCARDESDCGGVHRPGACGKRRCAAGTRTIVSEGRAMLAHADSRSPRTVALSSHPA